VIGEPLAAGAVQLTVACPSPAVAVTLVGGEGALGPDGLTGLDGSLAGPGPTALVATTVKV
jgi:hypothetical protein